MKKLLWVPAVILALGIFGCQNTSGPGVEGPIGADEMDYPDEPGFYGDITEAGSGDPISGATVEIWCRDCSTKIMDGTTGTGWYEAISLSAYSPHFGHSVQIRAFADGYEDFYSGEDLACPGEPTRYDIVMEPID